MAPRARASLESGSLRSSARGRAVAWFLAVSYGLGAPLVGVLEYRNSAFSERFDLPAWLIYTTTAIQLVCTPLVLSRRYARLAGLALSAITLGAVVSHFRIGSPLTAVPALFYTALQIWFAVRSGTSEAESAA